MHTYIRNAGLDMYSGTWIEGIPDCLRGPQIDNTSSLCVFALCTPTAFAFKRADFLKYLSWLGTIVGFLYHAFKSSSLTVIC